MKVTMRGLLFCAVASATSLAYGGQEASGVYGVEVAVKERPKKHDVTNAAGYFVLEGLPSGNCTLSFRAQRSKEMTSSIRDKVLVATSYSIKIEEPKGSINRSGLTSDDLLAGVEIPVKVGAGAKVRGQVLPGARKEMVWVPTRTGSNVPGHWAEKGQEEASPHNIGVYGPGNWLYR